MSGHEQGSSQTFCEELTFNICYPLKKIVVQKEILALTQLCYDLLHIQISKTYKLITYTVYHTYYHLGPLIKKIKVEENLKADEKINGDDQIKAEESTPTMTEPKKETLEELELSKTNNQLTKKLAMFENTLKSVQNDIVIPLKERITRLELEKKGSHFLFFKLKLFYSNGLCQTW